MVKLRLTRFGKKKRPFYRIVAMDSRSPRQGAALSQIGIYDPIHAELKIDEERALSWLNQGAQMSDTVRALLRSRGILARWRGLEGRIDENILKAEKPKRRRKLGSAAPAAGDAEGTPSASAESAAQEVPSGAGASEASKSDSGQDSSGQE